MAHCMPLEDRPRSCWIVVDPIDTIVWSMKVMATAKIIAVRMRLLDWPPALPLPLIVLSPFWPWRLAPVWVPAAGLSPVARRYGAGQTEVSTVARCPLTDRRNLRDQPASSAYRAAVWAAMAAQPNSAAARSRPARPPRRAQRAGRAVRDDLRDPAGARADHRGPAGHRLQVHDAQRLVDRRAGEHRGVAEQLDHLALGQHLRNPHHAGAGGTQSADQLRHLGL